MKRILLLIFTSLSLMTSAQNWQWAKQIGWVITEGGGGCLDANDNLYFWGSFDLSCIVQTDTFYSKGQADFFIAKYAQNGNEIWAKQFGGIDPSTHFERTGAREIDKTGNYLFVSGSFYGTLTIDTCTVTSYGLLDAFLAKFDLNGNCLWIRKGGSKGDDSGGAIQFDSNNNVIITGRIADSSMFGSISISPGTFLAKYDQNGNCLWAQKKFDGAYFSCIKYWGDDLIMTGTTTNDTAQIDTIMSIGTSNTDALLGRFDSSGNVKWIKRNGGIWDDYGISLDFDNQGNIYNSGYFKDSANFNGVPLTNGTTYDMYLTKFDSSGNLIWITQSNADGPFGARGVTIASDSAGKVYIVGSFGGNASFGSITRSTGTYYANAFVARYDSSGNCMGVKNFGEAQGFDLLIDHNQNVLISGLFIDTVNIGATTLISRGQSDIFIAKLDAITEIEEEARIGNNQLVIYANPNMGKCNITVPNEFLHEKNLVLSVYDSNGKIIQQTAVRMNENKIKLNIQAQAKGIYNVTLSNGKKRYNGRIVFE